MRTQPQPPRPAAAQARSRLSLLRPPRYLQAARSARCVGRRGPAAGCWGLWSSGNGGGHGGLLVARGGLWRARVLGGAQSWRFFPALAGASSLEPLVFSLPAGL